MKYTKGIAASAAFGVAFALQASAALALGTVSWLSPANNSSFAVGTLITPSGQASGGVSGGVGLDLALVLDESGSMTPTTTSIMQQAANALIAAVPQATSSIGVIGYGSSAVVLAPLQPATNQAALIAAVNSTDDNRGTTATDLAINAGRTMLTADNNGRAKQMVVISDGGPNNQAAAVNAATAASTGTPPVQVNTVGIPNTSFGNQQAIATAGGGVFVTATNLQALIDIFTGTSGNLVGIDRIDVTLPDGTLLSNVPLTSGVGNFDVTQAFALELGNNIWTVDAFFTNGNSAQATLNVIGTQQTGVVPLPAAAWLLISGIASLGAVSRMRRRA